MKRRIFLAAATCLPLIALAQQSGRSFRIGYLASAPPAANRVALEAFKGTLARLGYAEGKQFTIEYRWSDDDVPALSPMARELAALQVDLILAWTTPAVQAARAATGTIPIVMVGIADPVGSGLVKSLARPGGTITGVSNISAQLSPKLVQLVADVFPRATTLAGVRNRNNSSSNFQRQETETAARTLGLNFLLLEASTPADLEPAFVAMSRARADAAVFFADSLWESQRERIAELALKYRMPTVFAREENVEAGGLMAYGSHLTTQFSRAAVFVRRIMDGAKPAELPVEQPTALQLTVNLKTAKALSVSIPQSVLLRADRVIE